MRANSMDRSRVARLKHVALQVACVLFTMVVPVAALGQGVSGTLSGTVTDAQGGAIPGASVTAINESQGTRTAAVVTNNTGDFVVPNLAAGTYTLQVEMPQFKTLSRPGVVLNSGSRVSVGNLVIQVGGTQEIVTVTSEIPLVQTQSGERSFNVTTESVASLPLQNRSYFGLLALAPGVVPASGNTVVTRLGGGGGNNYMIDGTNTMDPSVNRPSQTVSVEAVSEVKVQTSGYSAEFGRASGVQINAVTKSGTNVFHGALYDVERDSKWNANTQANILSGVAKTLQDERDWGFALGGPVGKPGGNNKLFFYFNYERNPRAFAKDEVNRYRVPTLLERQGDFSQSLDRDGNLYPYIRDYTKSGNCNATSQAACFADGGVLGRIPADRLYQTGLAILRWWPEPNLPTVAGTAYNLESVYPGVNLVGYQPLLRVDYAPFQTLRGSFKTLSYGQPIKPNLGTLPGWNDTIWFDNGVQALSASINWTVNAKTFVEGNWGTNWVRQRGGGGLVQGAPRFARGANPINPTANIVTAGFGDLPRIYPDQWVPEPGTLWEQGTLKGAALGASQWDGQRIQTAPNFTWGNRIAPAPPNLIMPDDLSSDTWTLGITLTRVEGSHTLKAGYFHYNTDHIQGNFDNQGINFGQDTSNIFDTSFGFANAATGVFNSYTQNPRVEEGAFKAFNREAFIQDNWKMSRTVTLDYGVRVVNISQVWDTRLKSANFLPDRWVAGDAPVLYRAGCRTNSYPCAAGDRVALNPVTNQLLGTNTAQLIGTRVPGTGAPLNGVFAAGQGIDDRLYLYPTLKIAPRAGAAWDARGNQTLVFRGGGGVFYDRTNISQFYDSIKNPPHSQQTTIRYGQLQTLNASVAPSPTSALWATQYDQPLPISVQWNGGVQMTVPFSMVLDVAYTGQHSENGQTTVNINNIDLGTAFLPKYQNLAQATSANSTDPATSYVATHPDIVRFYQGYGAISMRQQILHRTYHSIQVSLNRRLKNGLAFGFYDTIGLSDKQNAPPRLQHNADGTVTVRDDQARADELLGNQYPQEHLLRANFTWRLPTLQASSGAMRAIGYAVNGWSLSGIWNGATGPYYAVSASYGSGGSNFNLTGSPDYAARVEVLPDVDLGGGCSNDRLRQFNTSAFRGPAVGSVGLESSSGYLKGCFISSIDLALARVIQLGGGRFIELRADVFNAFNQAGITSRNTTMNLASPATPSTITNLPDEANGVRTRPVEAGFGAATGFQAPRSAQLQVRFAF